MRLFIGNAWLVIAVLVFGAALLVPRAGHAASCCGGGSASALVLPKFSTAMVDISFDREEYDGFWNKQGKYVEDPPGSDLSQHRLNAGYAHRLADRWQASVIVPYVWNDSRYSGIESRTRGFGDTTVNLWYEAFDAIKCVWKVKRAADLVPAAYFGTSLLLPTGVSPFDDVANSFDITGRGFYRLDANLLLDKTIYPWNATLALSYGTHLERPVNREYGRYVEPYDKRLGDRRMATVTGGYTWFLDNMDTVTTTLAWTHLEEGEGEIDGVTDATSGMKKRSLAVTLAYATMDRDWVYKLTVGRSLKRDGFGENFPVTNVITLGVSHVLR